MPSTAQGSERVEVVSTLVHIQIYKHHVEVDTHTSTSARGHTLTHGGNYLDSEDKSVKVYAGECITSQQHQELQCWGTHHQASLATVLTQKRLTIVGCCRLSLAVPMLDQSESCKPEPFLDTAVPVWAGIISVMVKNCFRF